MNKKKINIILIPSTIAIWILIMIRVFSFTGARGTDNTEKSFTGKKPVKTLAKDTLRLLLDYRDPFVAGISAFSRKTVKPKNEEVFKKPLVVNPPSLVYVGRIEAGKDKKEVALAIINNHSVLVARNDTIMGMKIVNIFRDSLIIEFQKSFFTVRNTQKKNI
jgi:hypothetical protein